MTAALWRSASLRCVQRGVCLFVSGAGVTTATDRQLDPAEVLHVSAIVELVGVARGRVADQETDRAAVLRPEPRLAEPVDDDALAPDRLERDRDVEIVAVGVQGEIVGLGARTGPLVAAPPAARRRPGAWGGTARRRGPEPPRVAPPGPRTSTPGDVRRHPRLSGARTVPSAALRKASSAFLIDHRSLPCSGRRERARSFTNSHSSDGSRTLNSSFQRARVAGAVAPELERADLGDVRVEADRDGLAGVGRPRRPGRSRAGPAPGAPRAASDRGPCRRGRRGAWSSRGSGTRPARRRPGRTRGRARRSRSLPPSPSARRRAP